MQSVHAFLDLHDAFVADARTAARRGNLDREFIGIIEDRLALLKGGVHSIVGYGTHLRGFLTCSGNWLIAAFGV